MGGKGALFLEYLEVRWHREMRNRIIQGRTDPNKT